MLGNPRKKTLLAHSTMESKMVALTTASEEVSWLRNLLAKIPTWERPMLIILIYCDSITAIAKV